jgi:hypothetical protein
MLNVLKMRKYVVDGEPLNKILEDFKNFKESYPKLFELVLENKEDYLPELEEMLGHVELINTGVASLEDVTKVVKNKYDTKYIYPLVNNNITQAQKVETQAFIDEQKAEVEEITKKWKEPETKLN